MVLERELMRKVRRYAENEEKLWICLGRIRNICGLGRIFVLISGFRWRFRIVEEWIELKRGDCVWGSGFVTDNFIGVMVQDSNEECRSFLRWHEVSSVAAAEVGF
jgi:hypothetical protein